MLDDGQKPQLTEASLDAALAAIQAEMTGGSAYHLRPDRIVPRQLPRDIWKIVWSDADV